jgi:hypothetical protein
VEQSKGTEGPGHRFAPFYATGRPFGCQASRGLAEIPAEIRRPGSPVVLEIGGEGCPRGHGEQLTADVTRQDGDQPRFGPNAFQVEQACSRPAQPLSYNPDHNIFFTLARQEVEMIRTERSGSQHPKTGEAEPPPLLQGNAAKEPVVVDDQEETRPVTTCTDEPP